tara:strand:- start:7 stop:1128 length:1122 start_codon:yes stop_codon:yes gene_type:complete
MTLLSESNSETTFYLDLAAFAENLSTYRNVLPTEHKIMVMIKANAYGLGAIIIADLLEKNNVNYFGVAYANEGEELRLAGITSPIMVMNPGGKSFDKMLAQNLEPQIYSWESLKKYIHVLTENNNSILQGRIHIKIDTGMSRLGFQISDADLLIKQLNKSPRVKVISLMSHLSSAESPKEDSFTKNQGKIFNSFCDKIEKGLGYSCIRHISNTAATDRHPSLRCDMVRLGIGLFGYNPVIDSKLNLLPVAYLRSKVSHIHKISRGDSVSYGRDYISDGDRKIATIPIGYADGFPRVLSNGVGKVSFNGKLFPVIGRVCMDMTMIDISDSDIIVGDEVEVFGKDILVKDFAEACGTSPYEALTRISPRIKRIQF